MSGNRHWTKDEDNAIKAAYFKARFEKPNASRVLGWDREVCKEIGRTSSAVQSRMSYLLEPPAPAPPLQATLPALTGPPAATAPPMNDKYFLGEFDRLNKKVDFLTRQMAAMCKEWKITLETPQEQTNGRG